MKSESQYQVLALYLMDEQWLEWLQAWKAESLSRLRQSRLLPQIPSVEAQI